MDKARIVKNLINGRKDQMKTKAKLIHIIHGWEVYYNTVGKVWVAEKGDERVIRSNEAILADIVMKG